MHEDRVGWVNSKWNERDMKEIYIERVAKAAGPEECWFHIERIRFAPRLQSVHPNIHWNEKTNFIRLPKSGTLKLTLCFSMDWYIATRLACVEIGYDLLARRHNILGLRAYFTDTPYPTAQSGPVAYDYCNHSSGDCENWDRKQQSGCTQTPTVAQFGRASDGDMMRIELKEVKIMDKWLVKVFASTRLMMNRAAGKQENGYASRQGVRNMFGKRTSMVDQRRAAEAPEIILASPLSNRAWYHTPGGLAEVKLKGPVTPKGWPESLEFPVLEVADA
ncbi:hypothetical protein BAUCODRAFT_127381 [Baudoinia panamericana UAMH 10762]|uniref:Uncharacterized protein n=1 Tax=Baudoinia panamericana (strain UAMH 10762) TaxID=717646 RepID=M2MXU9_BAUPA|nr:uncharacterized protein BAUCODRAFT_127381 [Baudoinia panamericana UAMH 10762]EMC91484.1 hypothetical protein BAUCODRAFT_127381 [Baudoinia panamericana UAMH 10762]